MAPTTNIGSSTPINSSGGNIGSDLRRKVDQRRGRLADARSPRPTAATRPGRRRAVRNASNLTAQQALEMNVIDAIAPDAARAAEEARRLQDEVREAAVHAPPRAARRSTRSKPGFFTRLLNTLIDPNLLSLLFLAGIAGIGFEIFHPGVVLPGALGAVALVTALFGFSVLPISWAGLALILLGVALLGHRRARRRRHGALTIAGTIEPHRGDAAAVPQRPGAVPHVRRRSWPRSRVALGLLLGARRSRRRCRCAAGRSRPAWRRWSASRASRAATGSSSSTASCGARGPPASRVPRRASPSRSTGVEEEGLVLAVRPVVPLSEH